jgi:hypothetical protein
MPAIAARSDQTGGVLPAAEDLVSLQQQGHSPAADGLRLLIPFIHLSWIANIAGEKTSDRFGVPEK